MSKTNQAQSPAVPVMAQLRAMGVFDVVEVPVTASKPTTVEATARKLQRDLGRKYSVRAMEGATKVIRTK